MTRPRSTSCKHSDPTCAVCAAKREYCRGYQHDMQRGARQLKRTGGWNAPREAAGDRYIGGCRMVKHTSTRDLLILVALALVALLVYVILA